MILGSSTPASAVSEPFCHWARCVTKGEALLGGRVADGRYSVVKWPYLAKVCYDDARSTSSVRPSPRQNWWLACCAAALQKTERQCPETWNCANHEVIYLSPLTSDHLHLQESLTLKCPLFAVTHCRKPALRTRWQPPLSPWIWPSRNPVHVANLVRCGVPRGRCMVDRWWWSWSSWLAVGSLRSTFVRAVCGNVRFVLAVLVATWLLWQCEIHKSKEYLWREYRWSLENLNWLFNQLRDGHVPPKQHVVFAT